MIHLDTNFLIRSLAAGSLEEAQVQQWMAAGEQIGVDSIAWSAFLCGPVTPQQVAAASAIIQQVVAFDAHDAQTAAALFNQSGRRRGSLADCQIAAVCLRVGGSLVTGNVADFQPFSPAGLQ